MVFEKSLTAMVKGIRAHRGKETEYISQCLQEIQKEVTSKNMSTKSMAILKLAYLTMFGYDMSWSTFAIVEVMSHGRFSVKRPGYLASSMSFTDTTDVGLLTINLFKKDFGGKSQYETGMALSCLSSICTPEISRDIITDLVAMLSSSRAYLRKKTVLCLYRVFLKDPTALRTFFPKLKERLADEDQGVLTASVNTFLELARKNAKNYLSLVPQLYHILVNTTNNWCSIKLMKLFQLLCPHEPRLPARLVEPLTNLLNTTKAQSVEMEAIRCVLRVMPEGSAITALAIEKNQMLLNSADRNLRFLALEMFKEVLDKPQFKDKIDMTELNSKVLTCIKESDTTARKLALQLLDRILSPTTFADAVKQLLEFSEKTCSPDEFFGTILRIGCRDCYALVEDFAWYLLVLAEIARNPDSVHAARAASQFSDVAARVVQVRSCAVTLALGLLDRSSTPGDAAASGLADAGAKDAIVGIATPMVGSCAWVLGEYHEAFESPAETSYVKAARAMLSKAIQGMEPSIQTQCVWAATKLYLGSAKLGSPAVVSELHDLLMSSLPTFVHSTHVDVSERATIAMHMVAFLKEDMTKVGCGEPLLKEALLPVHADAQKGIAVPEELCLDEPFFKEEEKAPEKFVPVRPDPQDPYSLAATYKEDFGFLAAKEAAGTPAGAPAGDANSSMFYLGSKDQPGAVSSTTAPSPGGSPEVSAPVDPLEQMRERLKGSSAAGGVKYQVLRDDVQAPAAPSASARPPPAAASTPASNALPAIPEKDLTELQGRLWFMCYKDENIGMYACIRSKNARKQLLRIELRCEPIVDSSQATVANVKVAFPSAVKAAEADADGRVLLVGGDLKERSAKVKVNFSLGAFLAPMDCLLPTEIHYSLTSASSATTSPCSGNFELKLPATTFLTPAMLGEDDVGEYIQNNRSLVSEQAERATSLNAAGRSAESIHSELPQVLARCAGLCHFHCIQQGTATVEQGRKFLLTAQPPRPGQTEAALPGQEALPEGSYLICLCRGLAREGLLEVNVKVKGPSRAVCDGVAGQLLELFRELLEGRLRTA